MAEKYSVYAHFSAIIRTLFFQFCDSLLAAEYLVLPSASDTVEV